MVVTRYVFAYKLGAKQYHLDEDQYVLVNSLTGAVDVVDTDVIRAFSAARKGQPPELPEDKLKTLTARGYFYPSRADEDALVDRVVKLNKEFRARDSALCFVLCPTLSCNLRCPYCFEPHKLHEQRGLMSEEQVDQAFFALDRIREMRPDMPHASINLFGGEPLLPATRGIVTRIMAATAARNLPVSITSNGTHAHHFIDILRPYRDHILFDISMDGVKEIHDQRRITANGSGTFDRISGNLQLLLVEGFRVAVRMNLNERNVDQVPLFLEYVKERGWNRYPNFQVTVSPVTNYTGQAADGLIAPSEVESRLRHSLSEELLKEVPVSLNGDVSRLSFPISGALGESMVPGKFIPSLYYCEASGALFYCMGPDGFIYPCNQIIGDPTWAIGTYSPTLSIDDEKAAMWQGRVVTNMPKCLDCSVAFLCSGGCPVLATRTTGSPMDSYCGTSKKELANYIRSVAPTLISLSRPTQHAAASVEHDR